MILNLPITDPSRQYEWKKKQRYAFDVDPNITFPDNYAFATTMNKRLYEHPQHLSLKTIPYIKNQNYPIYCFHENSFEKTEYNNNDVIPKDIPNVTYIDLFEENPWMNDFLHESPLNQCYLSNQYYIQGAPFWFRKVVSIVSFVRKLEIGQIGLWIDCDCCIKNQFSDILYDYINNNDWLAYFRFSKPIESGFYIININKKTKEFAEKYLEYYTSYEVFKNDVIWADNYVMNTCFRLFGEDLKKGGLTPEFGCPVDIMQYIAHLKGNLQVGRGNIRI
jgi:hypothetical protein